MKNFPKKIGFYSDDTELKFLNLNRVKSGTEITATYEYTKASETTMGKKLPLPLSQIEQMLKNNILKIYED